MEKRVNKTKNDLAEKLDLPRDIVLNLPKITITGDNEIVIENHKGVMAFKDNMIKVNTNSGIMCIYGNKFEILFMSGSTVNISGKFTSIEYENNDQN